MAADSRNPANNSVTIRGGDAVLTGRGFFPPFGLSAGRGINSARIVSLPFTIGERFAWKSRGQFAIVYRRPPKPYSFPRRMGRPNEFSPTFFYRFCKIRIFPRNITNKIHCPLLPVKKEGGAIFDTRLWRFRPTSQRKLRREPLERTDLNFVSGFYFSFQFSRFWPKRLLKFNLI